MKPGRNDLCLCGSGKKYKHCCLAAERRNQSQADVAWTRVRRTIEGMPRRLGRFVAELYGPEAVEQAWNDFTLWDGPAFDPASPLMAVFFPWLYHSWEPDPYEETQVVEESLLDRVPTSVFLERHAQRIDPLCARYLAACIDAPFSFHEILRCDRGRGFNVRDLITGEEREVLEGTASEMMRAGDIVFGQLVSIEGVVLLEACSPYALSPIDKIRIIELRERIEKSTRLDPEGGDPRRAWNIEIREVYFELIDRFLDPRPPVLQNTDGELIELQRVVFDVDDADRALALLAASAPGGADAEVERSAGGRVEHARFAWIKAGNRRRGSGENTVLGEVEIDGTRLVAHVNSAERANAFRGLVEQTLGGAARYRGSEAVERGRPMTEHELLEDLEPGGGGAEQSLADSPEVREHVRRLLAEHYENWVTQEIPALGGRRPIDVVNEANGREKVEALIAEMERRESERGDRFGAAAFTRLRKRLGLARP